jgi:excisionase family DNA binding protein
LFQRQRVHTLNQRLHPRLPGVCRRPPAGPRRAQARPSPERLADVALNITSTPARAAAELAGVDERTVRRWVKAGTLAADKRGGRFLIARSALEPFVNNAVSAAVVHAKDLGVLEVIAVYDSTGILKALASVDGARVTSVTFAMDKAWTAARREAATQDLADALASQPAVNLPSFLKQPQLTLLGGGIPIVLNGQVVGGVGASGGSIAQDIEVANAGLAAVQH